MERARWGTRRGRSELSNLCGPRCGSRLCTTGAALHVEQALPRLHPHTSVLAPVSLKGLNPYLTGVSRKPPREQGRIKAEVGRKSAPVAQRCPLAPGAGPQALGVRWPRWGGELCAHPCLGGGPWKIELSTLSAFCYRHHTSRCCRFQERGEGEPRGPGATEKAAAAPGRSELPSPNLLQTIFIDFPARRAISVTSAQEFAPPIILQANLSG